MNSTDMTEPSLPADDGDPDTPGEPPVAVRRRRRWWMWGLGLTLLTGAVLGLIFVPTPYVLLEPGSVRSAEDRVEIRGAESFEDDEDVFFTTVLIDQATLIGHLRGLLDEAIEVRSNEDVYGPKGRDESQQLNRQRMDLSKLVATQEALSFLGFDARFTGTGARVLGLLEGSPSEGKIAVDDVIVSVDGEPVSLPEDLRATLADRSPGDTVTVGLRRPVAASGELASGEPETENVEVEVVLGADQEQGGRAILGVNVEPAEPGVESEVEVEIDSGTVTGPSAGLAWSLAIIDRLTPGSLTGRDVAVTGEILPDGSIGVVGGVVQKVATVKRNGIDVFLFPAATPEEEQAEMRRLAGDELELVPVATLAEAVEYLAPDGVESPAGP